MRGSFATSVRGEVEAIYGNLGKSDISNFVKDKVWEEVSDKVEGMIGFAIDDIFAMVEGYNEGSI